MLAIIGGSVGLWATSRSDAVGGDGLPPTSASAAQEAPATAALSPTPSPVSDAEQEGEITLSFAVAPHDASIFVDGKRIQGRSVVLPAAGTVVIEVSKGGFVSEIRTIEVAADEKLAFALSANAPGAAASDTPALKSDEGKRAGKKGKDRRTSPNNNPKHRRFVEDSPYAP